MHEDDKKFNTTIFVIDDDENVRRSIKRLLRSAGYNVEAFSSAIEYVKRSPYTGIGCLLLDVSMPGMTGPELQEKLLQTEQCLPIIFLTAHGDIPTGVQAMKKGASDFLTKPVDDEELLQAVALAVERHISVYQQEQEIKKISENLSRLSLREREVMEYVIGGWLNKQIASTLGISEKTIKVHRSRIMEKMQARSVAGLVRMCECINLQPRKIK